MLNSARIQNFRCLRDVTLQFSPLTVLVGANASGKSSVLRALDIGHLQKIAKYSKKENTWKQEAVPVVVRISSDSPEGPAKIVWNNTQVTMTGKIPRSQRIRLDLAAMRRSNLLAHHGMLSGDGSNLTNVFESLERGVQIELAERLSQLVPMFQDVQARPYPGLQQGHKILQFKDRWNSNVWHRADEVSDGTMLLLAYLVLQYQPSPPDLISVEEPERGIHPYLIGKLIEFLRNLAKAEDGNRPRMNVLLATHSPELLNFLEPEEVRFLRIGQNGATEIECSPSSSPEWEAAFEEYRQSLGEAWLSGGLGGVPGVPG